MIFHIDNVIVIPFVQSVFNLDQLLLLASEQRQ